MQNSSIRTESQYKGLLKEGYKKAKSEVIVKSSDTTEKGLKNKPYDLWTKEELYEEARKAGIPGRSYMNKKNLIKSLQNK
jgi:hypothetical protein